MRSSISNSEAGYSKWLKAWLLTVCLVLAVIVGWEGALRQAGLPPEYSDNRPLWLSARHRLSQPDANVVAILGASRVQRAVDVDTLSDRIDRPVVQLAIEGSSGLPVLEYLAADPRFVGTVLFSVAPAFSFNRRLSKLDAGKQADWMSAYVRQSRSQRIEQEMRLSVLGMFTFRSTDAAVSRTIPALVETGRLPGPDYKTTYRNRFVTIDQNKFEGQASQDGIVKLYQKMAEAYEPKGFAELLHYFSTLVDILKAKGCRVFVLRLPSEGAVLDFERELFPQDRFWNEMQRKIDAHFIHFEDYPQLNGYLSVDGSHVAAEKARAFTEELATVLTANGL